MKKVREQNFIVSHLIIRTLLLTLSILTLSFSQMGYGQLIDRTSSVKGKVHDTLTNKDCSFAIIAILDADSNLLLFTRTGKEGRFIISGLSAGHYRLLITHPAYSDYADTFSIQENTVKDFGIIAPPPLTDKLEAVVVTPRSASMRMRGDTLEYNTGNIKLKVNATVEELLSRLPGVQIDPQGNITVNGEKVQRLLVDGEDLFGGDPTIVTRNFNADMINKVQVLDKKSKQAEFTGVDDGQRTKTVNLTLKEDSKRGYFAKGEVGGDTQDYYNVNALFGSFKGTRQLAAFGMIANTGATAFYENNRDAGGGGINLGLGTDDAFGSLVGSGIPKVIAGGAHYANRWNEAHLDGNYQYGQMITHPVYSSVSEQILPDSIYRQNQNSKSINSQEQHMVYLNYDWTPDSLSAFQYSIGGNSLNGDNQFSSTGVTYMNDTIVNNSFRTIHSQVKNTSFQANGMWRVAGRKKRDRVFSFVAGLSRMDNSSIGYLYSVNDFYQSSSAFLNSDTIDERKVIALNALIITSSLNYTQPLWRHAILAVSYGLTFSKNQSQQATYDRGDGKYTNYDSSLSSKFQNVAINQVIALNIQRNNNPLHYTIGGDIIRYVSQQRDLLSDSVMKYSYLNFAPRINARYSLSSFKGIDFDYNGLSQQPSITQLQPTQNNNDPLHIVIGNPNLHASFSHQVGIKYHILRPYVFNIGLSVGVVTNDISTKISTDSLGRQISQAMNTNGKRNINVYISLSKTIKSINWDVGANTNLSYARTVNYVNTLLSRNSNYGIGVGVNFGKYIAEKVSFQLSSGVSFSYMESSINATAVTGYWSQSHSARLGVFILPALEVSTDCYLTWRQKTNIFDNNNQTIAWNAHVSKNLLENRLNIRWQVIDILGQNTGISRTSMLNQISQSNYNVIGRYWMLTATYRFIKHGKLK